jgi:transcriptional regulator with XRE-family HTH domain
MNKRLADLRKTLGITQAECGRQLGVSAQAISQMETGKIKCTDGTIKLLCLTFHVSERWLRTGEGEMFEAGTLAPAGTLLTEDQQSLLNVFNRLSPTARRLMLEYAEKLLADETALIEAYPFRR